MRRKKARRKNIRKMPSTKSKMSFSNGAGELHTLLHEITGTSEMLQEDVQNHVYDNLMLDLRRINVVGKQLLVLIDNIIDLSKFSGREAALTIDKFDVFHVIQELITAVEPAMASQGNVFHVYCSSKIGDMENDQTKLRQILLNLLSHAAEFTQKGSVILDVHRINEGGTDRIHIQLRNTGVLNQGVQKAETSFPFSITPHRAPKESEITDLGVLISKRFCKLMGGSFRVESEPGGGTLFTITLPARHKHRTSRHSSSKKAA